MKKFKLLHVLVLAGVAAAVVPSIAEASHFRFGHVTWVPNPGISPTTADFTVGHAWRRSACGGSAGDGFVAIGDAACGFSTLRFGDGGSTTITGTVVSIDPANDWYLATYSTTHTYATVNNGGVPWVAQLDGCCRIYAPQVNAPGTSFRVQSTVDLSLANSSPVSTIFPIIQFALGVLNTFPLPIGDADADSVTCRLATSGESGISVQPGPPNGGSAFPLSVTPACVLTWDTTGTSVGQLWAAQIVIEESRGGNAAHGRVALEFLILVVPFIGNPPVCDIPPTPTGTVTVPVGTNYSATIQGSDPDAGDTLTLNTTGVPAGATVTPGLPTSSASPVSSAFSWTPTAADVGPHPLLFSITDQTGQQALCGFTIDVPANQPPVCNANGPYSAECAGTTTSVALDGTGSTDPDNDPLGFLWTTDCPAGTFDNDMSSTPVLTSNSVLSPPCPLNCNVTLTVDDGIASDRCSSTVTLDDTTKPVLSVDTTPITVTDVDCSGDEAVSLPSATATDTCDASPTVTDDAPATFPAGQTTTVTFTATDDCGNTSSASVDVTVLYGADIWVTANKHTVGGGSNPGSTKEPFVGIEICAYDKADGSCARDTCGGISHQHYECIATTCPSTNCCTTDADGMCNLNLPPGDYVVISIDATKTTLPNPLGVSASDLVCGEHKQKHLQQICKPQSDGSVKKTPGKTTRRTGSELLIIEPEYVIWDGTVQEYPFVFETVGDWGITASVAPPEGFVSDFDSLSADVYDDIQTVQFTITEVGSDLVPTGTTFDVTHKGRREIIHSHVGIFLTAKYARSRGFNVAQLRAAGLIKELPDQAAFGQSHRESDGE